MTTANDLLNDPEKLASMTIEEIEAATAVADEIVEDKPKDGEKVESPATPEAINKTDVEDEPQGVLTKDGKNIIPYEVLITERDKSKELAKSITSAEARIAELEAQLKNVAVGDVQVDESLFTSQEEIEVLQEEMPEVAAKNVRKDEFIKQQAIALQQKNIELQRLQQSLVVDTAQLAIDSVPKLAFIQATKPALFSLAVSIDNQLQQEAKTDSAIAAMSLKERFELAVSKLEAEIGIEIDMKKSSKPSSEDLKKSAEQAKAAANIKASATPISMADIPGGEIPPAEEYANFFDKSPVEMEMAMRNMTEAQQNRLYARIR